MVESTIKGSKLHDITHFGIRAAAGVLFISHGIGKFNPESQAFFTSVGLLAEMQLPIALLESLGGVLLVLGILTRITSSLLAIEMLGAMFFIKKLKTFSGQGGWEIDLLALAILLVLIVTGPGRVSVSYIVKKIPFYFRNSNA